MARKQKIADHIFGSLDSVPGYWLGKVNLPSYSSSVKLYIEDGVQLPTYAQRDLYTDFSRESASLRITMQEQLYLYYQAVKEVYRAPHLRSETSILTDVPELDEVAEIWKLLSDPTITIPDQDRFPKIILCSWNCSWDIERGVAIVFRNLSPVKVGVDNLSILDDFASS